MDAEVIIVGGGPAGASTAWHLAKAGVDVLLVDRATFPRDKVCAEYLSPQCSRILSGMGALETVERTGPAHLRGMKIRSPDGSTVRGEFAASHGFRGFRDRGLALRRIDLDRALLDNARNAGVRVLEDTKVTGVVLDSGRVAGVETKSSSAPGTLRSRIVVGADGLRSVVGRRLNLISTRRWPRRIAFVAHYPGVEGVGEYGEMHVDREGYLGMADVGGGVTNVAVVVPAANVASQESRTDILADWVAKRDHLAPRFARATRSGEIRATGPFASLARRAWAPGAALVGDAADFFDPFTGEGVYAALRGGELLAPFIADALASPRSNGSGDRALAAYDRARRLEFRDKWRVERLVGAAVAFPFLANGAVRALSRRQDMADLLVGVAGDFVPASTVLRPGFILSLLLSSARR